MELWLENVKSKNKIQKCYGTIDRRQIKREKQLKYDMMLSNYTKHRSKGVVFHDKYNIKSAVSSTGNQIFRETWSDGGKHTAQSKPKRNIRMEGKI